MRFAAFFVNFFVALHKNPGKSISCMFWSDMLVPAIPLQGVSGATAGTCRAPITARRHQPGYGVHIPSPGDPVPMTGDHRHPLQGVSHS